jgi:hypothetical protein
MFTFVNVADNLVNKNSAQVICTLSDETLNSMVRGSPSWGMDIIQHIMCIRENSYTSDTFYRFIKKRDVLRIVEFMFMVYMVKYQHGYLIDKGGV